MMTLPSFLQESLDFKIQQFEEERTMPLLSNMELRGMERGKEIGKEIGALQNSRTAIKTVLQARLGSVTSDVENSLSQISDLSILNQILTIAATVDSLENFRQSIGRIQAQLSITEN
jgi:hypothetical protein